MRHINTEKPFILKHNPKGLHLRTLVELAVEVELEFNMSHRRAVVTLVPDGYNLHFSDRDEFWSEDKMKIALDIGSVKLYLKPFKGDGT